MLLKNTRLRPISREASLRSARHSCASPRHPPPPSARAPIPPVCVHLLSLVVSRRIYRQRGWLQHVPRVSQRLSVCFTDYLVRCKYCCCCCCCRLDTDGHGESPGHISRNAGNSHGHISREAGTTFKALTYYWCC